MQKEPNTGYHLDGIAISYMDIPIDKHYESDGSFLMNKLMEKCLVEFSQTGKVEYSNDHLMKTFKCSKRGLHYAMNGMDAWGIVKRVFVDNGLKNHREGFIVDVQKAKELLSKTTKDVEGLDRNDPEKHFVNQAVIKLDIIRRDIELYEKKLQTEKTQAKIIEMKSKLEKLYEQHHLYTETVARHAARIKRKLEKKITKDQREFKNTLLEMIIGQGYEDPPDPRIN